MDELILKEKLVEGLKAQRMQYYAELAAILSTKRISDSKKQILQLKYSRKISGLLDAQLKLCDTGWGESDIKDFYDTNKRHLFELLEEDAEEGTGLEKLKGDFNLTLAYIKDNCIEKNPVEILGYKGENVTITLPKVGNFEKCKISYFVSSDKVSKEDFENNPLLKEKSSSKEYVFNLLEMIKKFLMELQILGDGFNRDYDFYMGTSYSYCSRFLNNLQLDGYYWLKDETMKNGEKTFSSFFWVSKNKNSFINIPSGNEESSKLFLNMRFGSV